MRFRLTLKFLVKSFVVVIVVMFLLPIIMNQLDSHELETAKKNLEKYKARRKRTSDFDNNEGGRLKFEPADSALGDSAPGAGGGPGGDTVLHQPDKHDAAEQKVAGHLQDAANNLDTAEKKYGPKAEFKAGILGNFEPNIAPKTGPGEKGEAVYTSMAEKPEADRSVREFGFNMVASDKISMTRTIPDTRLDECKYWYYPEELPTASVIIVFHNEGWSTLMRTVHSVIEMSPKHLLHEVVMVDDFSDKVHLKDRLDEYVKQFNGKVKLYRNKERLGLIMTRTLGAEYSTGEAIVFLDAHCECNKNWLVPLLARIAYDRTILAVPLIDSIHWENFRLRPVYAAGSHFRGIFEWGFLYKESRVPQRELGKRAYDSEPYWSPTHAGGLFAIDRKYFFELGAYDPGLQIWGGENFELSFKIWLSGGSIEWVPCSRVGHVYRNAMPYGFGKISSKIPVVLLNYMRVVEVWLDPEFQDYFYTREPTVRGYPVGNITAQLDFKKKHQKHSFKWFMDNIAYEVWEKFPAPPPNKGWGEIKQREGTMCWDTMGQSVGGGPIGLSVCHHFGGNQMYRLNTKGQLAVGERCMDSIGTGIGMVYCPASPTGPWDWDKENGSFRHREQNKCATTEGTKLVLRACDATDKRQQFDINEVRTWR